MQNREPPSAPEIPPKVRLDRSAKLGLPFLFLLPALAMVGVFGPTTEVAHGRSGAATWSVEYPARLRFRNSDRLIVRVANPGRSPLAQVRVAFDPDYIQSFTAVGFEPAPDQAYVVDIGDLEPGESALVSVDLTADDYGSQRGWIALTAGQARSRIALESFVFP